LLLFLAMKKRKECNITRRFRQAQSDVGIRSKLTATLLQGNDGMLRYK
jgi:hypothetical protein